MIDCKEVEGKVVRSLKLYPLGWEGSEVSIDFTDGTSFTANLKMIGTLEAKVSQGEGPGFQILKDYTSSDTL